MDIFPLRHEWISDKDFFFSRLGITEVWTALPKVESCNFYFWNQSKLFSSKIPRVWGKNPQKHTKRTSNFPQGKTLGSLAQNLGKSRIFVKLWANWKWKKKTFLKISFWSQKNHKFFKFFFQKTFWTKRRKNFFWRFKASEARLRNLSFIINHIQRKIWEVIRWEISWVKIFSIREPLKYSF